jgi:hypothetical protein
MALESQIRRADSKDKPGLIDKEMSVRAQHLLAGAEAPLPEQVNNAARQHVRRLANRHSCPGQCDAPEHHRDVAAALHILDALGLDSQAEEEPSMPELLAKASGKKYRRPNPPAHGTLAAYQAHLRAGQNPCPKCHARHGYDPDKPEPEARAYDVSDPRAPVERWTVQLPGCVESTPAVWKGRIWVGSRDGFFYAIGDP